MPCISRRAVLLSLGSVGGLNTLGARAVGVPQTLVISRQFDSNECTTGYLSVDGQQVCYTLELPDNANRKSVSRIPAGFYAAHVRCDHDDQGERWRIELNHVPGGREHVEIHVGNWAPQTEGCILVGLQVSPNRCTINGSQAAYAKLRRALYGTDNPAVAAPVLDLTVEIRAS